MNNMVVEAVIGGNIEALDQGLDVLNSLSDEQYTHVASPYVTSHIGQHFRHLVDLFFSVVNGARDGRIDYDTRRRGALIETSRAVAMEEINAIKAWMEGLLAESGADEIFTAPIDLTSEVTLENTNSVTFNSTLLRELVFTSSHAVHHFAIINIIAKMQGVATNEALGVAPASATFLREVTSYPETECAQ